MRGFGGVCEICKCLARGVVGGEGVRELGLGFTNPLGATGVLDVCLCLSCGVVGGIGGERVGDWNRVWKSWVVLCMCEL